MSDINDDTMRVWSVDTGSQKEEFDGGSFQGQLFGSQGGQVQYHLPGRPVAHLRRSVGGDLFAYLMRPKKR